MQSSYFFRCGFRVDSPQLQAIAHSDDVTEFTDIIAEGIAGFSLGYVLIKLLLYVGTHKKVIIPGVADSADSQCAGNPAYFQRGSFAQQILNMGIKLLGKAGT